MIVCKLLLRRKPRYVLTNVSYARKHKTTTGTKSLQAQQMEEPL